MRYQEDTRERKRRAGRWSGRDGSVDLPRELCDDAGARSPCRPSVVRLSGSFAQGSREQLAIAEFAAALLVIPKTLAVNAAKDSTDLVAKLRAYHHKAQSVEKGAPERQLRHYGLDLLKGEVRDNLKAGVLEPTLSKVKSYKVRCCFLFFVERVSRRKAQAAIEACTALLRIDDSIVVPKEERGGPDPHDH